MKVFSSTVNNRGYSFVEVLVAISVLLLGVVGPLTIASKGLQNAIFAREQTIAYFLAQEGLEDIQYVQLYTALQDINAGNGGSTTWNWTNRVPANCFTGGACGFAISNDGVYASFSECTTGASSCQLSYLDNGNRFPYRDLGDTANEIAYARKLYFEEITSDIVVVRSVVSWQSNAFANKTKEVELRTIVYDHYGHYLTN